MMKNGNTDTLRGGVMTYESLLKETVNEGIKVKEKSLEYDFKGLYCDGRIIIDTKLDTDCEKRCILSEELGHHFKTFGDITDQTKVENRKQELVARRWGYEKLVGVMDLIRAYEHGCQNRYEIAEYLNVTEEFLDNVLYYYSCRYPEGCSIDSYWLDFDGGLNIFKKY